MKFVTLVKLAATPKNAELKIVMMRDNKAKRVGNNNANNWVYTCPVKM